MSKIIQLDPHLANLIAAGEVVERPASVVKELVENSIDAGAKTVTVEIQNGGMTFLRVSDDGCGMSREDAKTAFLRHATSKLRRKEDLEAIGTLGFRGEALAATAAVSRVDLLTRTADDSEGTSLCLEAGKLMSCESAGCPVGTTIVVRDLFYNTPARMKFMKRDSVEASAAAGAVQKQALAHPEISFRMIKDGEQQFQTPGDGQLLSAVYSVLGRQTAGEMIPVESKWEKLSVSGYVSRPTATRGTRAYQIFFVNRRLIRSKTLTAALEEAYRNQIMTGRFPSCVLNLTVPLSAVDVNVHPAKTEVKFLNEREIFDCVHYGVKGALAKAPGQVAFQLKETLRSEPETGENEALGSGRQAAVEPAGAGGPEGLRIPLPAGESPPKRADEAAYRPVSPSDGQFFKTMTAEAYRSAGKPSGKPAQPVHTVTRWEYEQMTKLLRDGPKAEPSQALLDRMGGVPALHAERQRISDEESPSEPAPPVLQRLPLDPVSAPPAFRYVGEVFRTYILAEQGDDLILIDKHAAHERINFERLRAQGDTVIGQTLLTPLTCRLDREEAALLLEHREELLRFGYDLDDIGGGDLLLRQIPAEIRASDAPATLSEIAGHLQNGRIDTPERLRDEALHTIACKAAIKAGDITDRTELEQLAAQVLSRDDLKYCPHGRPICVVLTKKQFEKQFKR